MRLKFCLALGFVVAWFAIGSFVRNPLVTITAPVGRVEYIDFKNEYAFMKESEKGENYTELGLVDRPGHSIAVCGDHTDLKNKWVTIKYREKGNCLSAWSITVLERPVKHLDADGGTYFPYSQDDPHWHNPR